VQAGPTLSWPDDTTAKSYAAMTALHKEEAVRRGAQGGHT
jgi:hypothetical protein